MRKEVGGGMEILHLNTRSLSLSLILSLLLASKKEVGKIWKVSDEGSRNYLRL